jgi:phosphocarrier protein FPr
MTSSTSSPGRITAAIALKAPLSGYLVPIEQVPDPVFAQKMVGDGVSIDPTNQTLVAPCDGEVIQLHPAHHAVTLKTIDGLEVLIHIGLDTVALKGEGFTARAKVGDLVQLGTPLIDFDADYIALHAKSLLTQIVITNSDRVSQFLPYSGNVQAGQTVVLEMVLADAAGTVQVQAGETMASEPIVVPNPTGLHARPAAVLANLAKKYQSDIRLKYEDKQANVRSVVGLMGLEIGNKARVQLIAQGVDAREAIVELSEALRAGLGEEGATPIAAPASVAQFPVAEPAPRPRSDDPNRILGVAASPGVAVGSTYRIRHQEIAVAETATNSNEERRQLERSIAQAKLEIEALRAKVHGQKDADKAAIFAAHMELLEDPELMDIAYSAIAKGKSAAYAWKQTYMHQAEQLSQLKNELLAARANDLRDVGGRVLRLLTGSTLEPIAYPDNSILLAEDLTPSDTATMDPAKVKGFCTVGGGATSHVSILARAMDIPAIAGAEPRILDIPDGTPVILDGSKGILQLYPTPEDVERIQTWQTRLKARRAEELNHAEEPAITQDGHRIEVVANIGSKTDAQKAIAVGTEGVGLLRSEIVFMDRPTAPTEDEQAEIYSSVAQVLGPDHPLIIRTLDVGGDKPLPYLPIPHEENPFLGERGVRLGFDRPEILRTQLRAILRASRVGQVKVMFPMIARMEDWRMAYGMLQEESQNLSIPLIPAGIMVEVPSTAIMADQFAREVDFFSVGTNDLTQYTLAMDRGHPKLAAFADALNPSVLKLIGMAAQAANKRGKWCGVCGGMASDPQAVPVLIGLGVKELSVSIPSIPSIKAQIRRLNLAECRQLTATAIALDTAAEVRALCPIPEE